MFGIIVVQEVKTHNLYTAIFSENRAVYEIMSKNEVQPERLQKIWRLGESYWMSKTTRAQAQIGARTPTPTHTHSPTHARHARTHTHKIM